MGNVVLLGLVSFFSDISSEMVYPLVPLYLTGVFGATPVLVGIIEGIAESLAALLKVFSGYLTDRYRHRKGVAFGGYAAALVYKILLLCSASWFGVLAARAVDRMGKGIRTAPRDALVGESASGRNLGKAFGLHKTLDMAGSAIGVFLAFLLLSRGDGDPVFYRRVFTLSIVPVVCALVLFPFIKEKRASGAIHRPPRPSLSLITVLDRRLRIYLLVTFLFTLGNSSNAFLLLRAKDMGFDDGQVLLLYLLYHVVASVLAFPLGRRSDRNGRKRSLVVGYLLFSLVYFGFAFPLGKWSIVVAFALYGLHTALIVGVERAFIAELAPRDLKGTLLGLQATIVGIALLPASAVAGLLWNVFGVSAPFLFGAFLSLLSAFLLQCLLRPPGAESVQS